jgi:hypothetical protein
MFEWSSSVGVATHALPTARSGRPYGAPGRRSGRLEEARAKAKAFLKAYPKAAYMTEVERWRELPGGDIEFTMRRLRTAD